MLEENVLHGPPAEVSPVTYSSGTFIYQKLIENIHQEYLFINEIKGDKITHKDFLQYACRLADSLGQYGFTSKNIAALCCENVIEFFIPVVACLFRGIPVVPVNPVYTESELTHALDLTEPDIIFCTSRVVNKVVSLKKRYSNINTIIVIDSDRSTNDVSSLREFINRYSMNVDIYTYKPIQINDIENHIAFIMFSSGTTGLPKGVMITHKNVNVKNATFLESSLNLSPERQSQYAINYLPFFHAFGLHGTINAIIAGKTTVILEKFDFELYIKSIANKSPVVDKYDLSHVERAMVGAGPISEDLEKAVKKRTGIKQVGQGYGLTESTVALTFTPFDTEKHGSCGKLLPHLSAVVKDLETGRNLGPNQTGELCFKGGVIMKGYYKNATANRETFTKDGYMRTGDVGYYDEEGFFYIVDRLKELIKYKGYQVPPAELEAVLLTNSKIKEVAVVGVPDADAGELPLAFVVKQSGVDLTQKEVVEFVKNELTHAFNLVHPDIVFCSDNSAESIIKLKEKFSCIKTVIILNLNQDGTGIQNIHNFISNWSSIKDLDNYRPVDVSINDHIALIMFSSGTTGLPKGVMITHRNFNTRRAVMLDPNVIYKPTTNITLGVLPFFHIFGLNTIITAIQHGRMVVVVEKFDPILYLSCIEKYKIEMIVAAPAILQLLAKSPLVDKFDLSHVKDILVGSAPLSPTLEEAVKKRLPVKYVRQGYSMTEGTATFVSVPPNTERVGSCGKLYPSIIGAVKDIETEENLGPLKTGQLCFKGDAIMKGYYKNEEATKEAFTRDGYLKTGDVGYYDHDGYFYVIDRIKELIKYKGYQVAPAELEAILIAHPNIKDVAVVGIPDASAGELAMAFVVRQLDANLTEDEVKSYLNEYVSNYKRLHGGVKFVDEIPRNSLGKIDRKRVKAIATNIIKSKL
ncbi:long-chain-fatty-acid--coa ligase [Holotrichia oblita]|uniref:Long-chain-fatty-acid--coa ligase n=1 Tax=Holotrichia oblita TaxID=644536 RepID=A0ACB9TTB0_HOLOL|nr:long-chain-fatty-acid--coa ligase [Holotrichia oblita]